MGKGSWGMHALLYGDAAKGPGKRPIAGNGRRALEKRE